jgi:hypothetical protein
VCLFLQIASLARELNLPERMLGAADEKPAAAGAVTAAWLDALRRHVCELRDGAAAGEAEAQGARKLHKQAR